LKRDNQSFVYVDHDLVIRRTSMLANAVEDAVFDELLNDFMLSFEDDDANWELPAPAAEAAVLNIFAVPDDAFGRGADFAPAYTHQVSDLAEASDDISMLDMPDLNAWEDTADNGDVFVHQPVEYHAA
jgi:hypothetical protein